MELKKGSKWALLAPTSMGARLTPEGSQPVHSSATFTMQATSAESNVLTIAASLGFPVKILTAFVKESPIARLIKDNLAGRHITWEAVEYDQDGPWGPRHQFNIADSGYGARGPRVYNDRAGEAGRLLKKDDFDLDRIFGKEGVQVLHLSGLIAALSDGTSELCLELAKIARKTGTLVSFDLNHRASFWKGREKKLTEIFREIASLSDILTGNEEDFQLCLGIKGPETGGVEIKSKISSFREMITIVKKQYPSVKVFANTLREVIDSNEHLWGAMMLEGDSWHTIEPRKIKVLDRIGGGDAFIGGLLYGILRGWEGEKCLEFGWASGALAVTLSTDYVLPSDEEQVWSIWQGNARVKR